MPGYRRGGGPQGGGTAGGRAGAGQSGGGTRAPRPATPPRQRPPARPVDDEEADYQLPGEYEEDAAPQTPLRRTGSAGRRPARLEPEEGMPRARVGGRGRPSRRDYEETQGQVRLADLCAEFFSLILQLRATGEMPERSALMDYFRIPGNQRNHPLKTAGMIGCVCTRAASPASIPSRQG